MIFEDIHSFSSSEFTMRRSLRNFPFPKHIHRSFELFVQVSGMTRFTIDEKEYILRAGEAVLIFPYQYHSLEKLKKGRHNVFFFSPDIVPEFYKSGLIPTNSKMKYSGNCKPDLSNPLLCRSVAYDICGNFDKNREYREKSKEKKDDVLTSILIWADENYSTSCLLQDAAKKIGYNYAYVSKLFFKKLGITFNQYVNLLRIQKSEGLLASSNKSITEIAHECGFTSLRNYNRKFVEVLGTTPTEYRKAAKK